MRIAAFLVAAVLALLAGATLVGAHVESYAQSKALQAGPYLVFFEPRPAPPFAESPASMVAQISSASTGALEKNANATILVAGPEEFSERKKMENDGTGYLVASMTFPARGNYSVRIFVKDAGTDQTHAAESEFEVFPNIPYRVRPVDQTADVITGQRVPLAFELDDPITLAPKHLADLRIKLEHWSDDHTTFLGEQAEVATNVGNGVWRIEPVFAQSGMYHIRFASTAGGFNYADVPLLHVYATSPQSAGIDEKDTSAAGAFLIVGLVALVAILRRR